MTTEQIVYDIRRLLRATKDDSEVMDDHLINIVNSYREMVVADVLGQRRTIDYPYENLFQPLGIQYPSLVDSGDVADFNIATQIWQTDYSKIKLGKLKLPELFDSPNALRIYSLSRTDRYHPISIEQLMLMIQLSDDRLNRFRYYTRIGSEVLITPRTNVRVDAILKDPRDGKVIQNHYISNGTIIAGVSYTVYEAPIIYNSIQVDPGNEFTGLSGQVSWTALSGVWAVVGKVKFTNLLRSFDSQRDEYPLPDGAIREIILNVLTKDFGVERQQVADLKVDSADEQQKVIMR
jgi:hypothetical protein